MSQALTGKLASLNPFGRSRKHDDDRGDEIDEATIGGGGHGARATDITKHDLHTSRAQKAFLVNHEILSKDEAGLDEANPTAALLAILEQPHAILPAELTDRSFRLPEYFISSSHNTYLRAHQLFGSSAADSYAIALTTGSRCVEIDAWDDDDNAEEPKVTHGYTLVSHISLRAVCETIRDVIDKEAANAETDSSARPSPIVVSLENHCGAHGQLRIAEIMTEVLGHRLLSQPLPSDEPEEHVTLEELGAKVIVMVEHHIPGEQADSDTSDDSSDSSDSSEDEAEEKEKEERAHQEYKEKKKAASATVIIPELAALGVYAQSVKPSNNSWFDPGELLDRPHHHLINVSESGLSAHLPAQRAAIARHNSRHLMRVFPKGTRISSRNLHPVPFWAVGAQVSALNWQRFDATMQLNEALFQGSDGYVLKPAVLRAGGSYNLNTGERVKLRLHVAGAAGIPIAEDRELDTVRPYLTCSLVHPDDLGSPPSERKSKTKAYKRGGLRGALGSLVSNEDEEPLPTDPLWDEVLEWEYEDNELVFLRLLVKNEENWSANQKFVVAAVRLSYVQPGWKFIRMLDLRGRETKCSLLVKFEVTKV